MQTIPSLEAQNRFGELLDTAQREPVIITRRGRPVSLVLSPVNDIDALQRQFARALSELAPLRGAAAAAELQRSMAGLGEQARREGLTEQDVQRLVDED
ncbi:MAG: type II toxin-antitoxin system Phd/YefM family antitoxin [Burkholderiaceae bacterium]|nr:type II toxin-antitoxin system Phd/YefM family antitoxin [Burkholderiaceae bacterium]MEB2318834.1 type II toxin-antitoxin system Phd/YefM family antitoxin [Pseudomonadota bacterium]